MKIQYQDLRFGGDALETIAQANRIIAEFEARGVYVTLRQVYYQFVARGLTGGRNEQKIYKRLGDVLNRGRLAGLISWQAMEDRTRNLESRPSWFTTGEFMGDVPHWFHRDLWDNQPYRVIFGIEKDAGVGTIAGVCHENDCPYISCRGYLSQSEAWRLGRKMEEWIDRGQRVVFGYLGDHDPSGKDMTRDLRERLSMFCGHEIDVRRLALNMDQVETYNPPPNPVKLTDSRAGVRRADGTYTPGSYRETQRRAGYDPDTCWEMEALSPITVIELVQELVDEFRDPVRWNEAVDRQEELRSRIIAFTDGYEQQLDEEG